jgi:hypothetical protein
MHGYRAVDPLYDFGSSLDVNPDILGVRMIQQFGNDQLTVALHGSPCGHCAAKARGGDVQRLPRPL